MGTLGNYNNNKDKENYQPSVYSRYSFSNTESEIDATKLGATFWNGLLKLSIAPFNASVERFDYDNEGSIYLSPYKAKMFAEELKLFLKDKSSYNNMGVTSGKGMISISNGVELTGKVVPMIIIMIINEDGGVESEYVYEIKTDYHYAIRNFSEKDTKFDKVAYEDLEILMLIDLLEEYYKSSSGAYAYSNIDQGRFNNSRINTKLDSICSELGIEYGGNSYNKGGTNRSVFDKEESTTRYSSSTIDDIESQMG